MKPIKLTTLLLTVAILVGLVINENFEQDISVDDQISYLIDKAVAKHNASFTLSSAFDAVYNSLALSISA